MHALIKSRRALLSHFFDEVASRSLLHLLFFLLQDIPNLVFFILKCPLHEVTATEFPLLP